MTFFRYRKEKIEHRPHRRDDDIRSVKSIPDDIQSLVESNSGLVNYQHAAVNYIVKMFTGDQELLDLYHEATQLMDEAKFVKNHQRLLKTFFLDLRSEGHSPSQTLAVGFLRSRSKRIHISSAIRSLIVPFDDTVREKINIMLEQEKDSLFLLDRLLDDRDSAAQPAPENTTDESSDGKPGVRVSVSNNSEDSEDSDDGDHMISDESEPEIQEDNALSKLEATAEFLTSGRPFTLYKENLRGFLHPTAEVDDLRIDAAQNDSLLPQELSLNYSDNERDNVIKSGPLQVQAYNTSQLIANIDCFTGEGSRNLPKLGAEKYTGKFFPSLPLFVDMVLRALPLPESEPPIPMGKIRVRWRCVGLAPYL
jgi:hypothetical protein